MSLLGVESVTYGVEDLDATSRMLEDFGLSADDKSNTGARFTTAEGSAINVRLTDDPGLPAPACEGPTVREVVWAASDRATLEAIGAELSKDRAVAEDADGVLHTVDPAGFGLAFAVSDLDRSASQLPPTDGPRAPGTRVIPPEKVAPFHLGHIVFEVQDPAVVDFYLERLPFLLSDRTPFGAFMRCDSATNHHNLFILPHMKTRVQHTSFRVTGIDEMMIGKEQLEAKGWNCAWGPGRHPPGSQLFTYYNFPGGGWLEYHADEDCILDSAAWVPREYELAEALSWGGFPPMPGS